MLRELTKADWLSILGIPEQRISRALLLRGTRNLKAQYDHYRQFFSNLLEVGCPKGIIEDVFIGNHAGQPVAYTSVYGAAMASEVVHIILAVDGGTFAGPGSSTVSRSLPCRIRAAWRLRQSKDGAADPLNYGDANQTCP